MPRVSIITPTFNCAPFLGRALDTAVCQTYTDYEIIVVDDGSTDGTPEVVSRFGDRLRYFYQPNEGLSSARNLGLSQASGEFIAYLDADDLWYPHKLESQVAYLDAHKECGLVHSDSAIIDEADNVVHARFNGETRREVPQGYCTLDLLRRCHVQILTVLERRECFERVGNFDERLKTAQDYLHWIHISMEGMPFGYVTEPLAMYRRTTNSLSASPRRVLEDFVLIFEDLSSNRSLFQRFGEEAAEIARQRLYETRRELAYLERSEGQSKESMLQVLSLIRRWPLRRELYADLLKAYAVPALMTAPWIRKKAQL